MAALVGCAPWRMLHVKPTRPDAWQPPPCGIKPLLVQMRMMGGGVPPEIPEEERMAPQPRHDKKEMRRLPIRAQDFARIGYTDGCPGCRSCITGDKVQGHTDACRQRVMAELRRIGDPRIEREVGRIEHNEA